MLSTFIPATTALDLLSDRGKGFGAFDNSGPEGDAAALSKAFKQAAISAYGTAGPAFVRRIIAEGAADVAATRLLANGEDAATEFIGAKRCDDALEPEPGQRHLGVKYGLKRKLIHDPLTSALPMLVQSWAQAR